LGCTEESRPPRGARCCVHTSDTHLGVVERTCRLIGAIILPPNGGLPLNLLLPRVLREKLEERNRVPAGPYALVSEERPPFRARCGTPYERKLPALGEQLLMQARDVAVQRQVVRQATQIPSDRGLLLTALLRGE